MHLCSKEMPTKNKPLKISNWLMRLQAIGFGILLLLIIEGGFMILGFGKKDPGNDPFIGFSGLEPLFGINPISNQFELRAERSSYFMSNGFSRYKDADTMRIFVFGGSTVQGRPYSIETAFPEWLRINFQLAYPGKKFEVVNCGGISYASYRLVPLMKECLLYDPDLFILCTGQNEFLEARTYGSLKRLAKPLGGVVKAIRNLATYQAFNTFYINWVNPEAANSVEKRSIMKREVDALLDYRRGLEAYHRDDKWKEGVIAHFQENIQRIDTLSQRAGIPLVILNPPVNLKDTPPFKSEHSGALSEEQIATYEELLIQANDHFQTDSRKAVQYLQQAIELDPKYAMAHYSLGHCYLKLGEFDKAEESFTVALIEDVCPIRILPSMWSYVDNYCRENDIVYLDLQALLKQHSGEPVIGSEILVDHVHPSIRGHQIIAEATAGLLFESLPIVTGTKAQGWELKREEAYEAHLETLDTLYFSYGNLRLDNLLKWTKGQADGPPIEMHVPIEPR